MVDRPLRVLLAASEVTGFAKTGGLADVAAALPRALHRRGLDVRVVLPLYRGTRSGSQPIHATDITFDVQVGPQTYPGRVWQSQLSGSSVPVYLVEQTHFFERDGLYQFTTAGGGKQDYHDNGERYIFFCRAILEMLPALNFWPDLLHANDWQTGLAPVYLRELYGRVTGRWGLIRTLYTIHNIAYQGQFPPLMMALTGLDSSLFHYTKMEFYGNLSFLKAGLTHADAISTVSPRYADEIQTMVFGCGLESTLTARKDRLFGIINGIDYDEWNPATDPHLAATYDADSVFERKPWNKVHLQETFHLPRRPGTPVLGLVARLAEQKGIELIVQSAAELLSHDLQLIILGDGDPHYRHQLQSIRDHHPDKVGVWFGFNEAMAHQIEGGADMFLMPSKYEPSGLNQLYSLRYGTVPVVRAVGGLMDTITDTTPETLAQGTATGFRFGPYTAVAFQSAVHRALACYQYQPEAWRQIIRTGMRQNWSWDRSAAEYEALYRKILGR